MDLKKRCQWCGKYFIAHKMTTLYCSSSCIDKAYKAKKKQQIKEQVEEEQQSKLPIVGSIGQKPFLSPQEAACLLGVSLPTIYRYMAQGLFKAQKSVIYDYSELHHLRADNQHLSAENEELNSQLYTLLDQFSTPNLRSAVLALANNIINDPNYIVKHVSIGIDVENIFLDIYLFEVTVNT